MRPLISHAKRWRSLIIRDHLQVSGHDRVVVFTCGNAADALRAVGLEVLEVGPRGPLRPSRWWTPADIARAFPYHFDATPGHLPLPLLAVLADRLQIQHGPITGSRVHLVPSGSGETIAALTLAYPHASFARLHSHDPALSPIGAAASPVLALPAFDDAWFCPSYRTGVDDEADVRLDPSGGGGAGLVAVPLTDGVMRETL